MLQYKYLSFQTHCAIDMNDSTADGELAKKISILLLKTKSFPHDGYERYFAAPDVETRGWAFQPIFVPVLEHRFLDEALTIVTCLLKEKQISSGESARYGGLIFTSQRAVEAFAKVVEERRGMFFCYLLEVLLFTPGLSRM